MDEKIEKLGEVVIYLFLWGDYHHLRNVTTVESGKKKKAL